jgi:hypothetical protein
LHNDSYQASTALTCISKYISIIAGTTPAEIPILFLYCPWLCAIPVAAMATINEIIFFFGLSSDYPGLYLKSIINLRNISKSLYQLTMLQHVPAARWYMESTRV